MQTMDLKALEKLSYGLFLLTVREGSRDNGCIINTAQQVTVEPDRVLLTVNRGSLTCEMLERTGVFNLSVLSTRAGFDIYRYFGMQSGRKIDKCAGREDLSRSANGLCFLTGGSACALISGVVEQSVEIDTHRLFVARVTELRVLSEDEPATYAFYHQTVKPAPAPSEKKGWRCKVCGYLYEGEALPAGYVCPLCGHGATDFEPVG